MPNTAELRRYGLLAALAVVGYLMVLAWNDDYGVRAPVTSDAPPLVGSAPATVAGTPDVPTPVASAQAGAAGAAVADDVPIPATSRTLPVATGGSTSSQRLVEIRTDVIHAWIDLDGGDIVKLLLLDYPVAIERPDAKVVMFNRTGAETYLAQSGWSGPDGPDASPAGRPLWQTSASQYDMGTQASLDVTLTHTAGDVRYAKTWRFTRGSYAVVHEMRVANDGQAVWQGHPFYQLKRDGGRREAANFLAPMPFLGAALTTADENYVKVGFEELEEAPVSVQVNGGWIAILQHYFLSAWIPPSADANDYYGRKARDGNYLVGLTGPLTTVNPGTSFAHASTLYVGPKITSSLATLAPHLELTIDYGILWFIAIVLFWMLEHIHTVVGNWGVAIILLTLTVKVILYPPSAASYRSMARLRELAPQMKRLQERHADDRQKLSEEMMALYRREKVNPMGSCLPMLIQMPVFLALYWVLYESVELRQAPFFGWIQDLSVMDPWFVLPILQGITMYVQQMLSPAPPDPIQARMFKIMPFIFTVMFAFFPSGLVLYWLISNVISIGQQYYVTKQVERASAA